MSAEEFLISAYKNMDQMKSQIQARYAEIHGLEPSTGELAQQCWDIWRLTTFHLEALDYWNREGTDDPSGHALSIPLEFIGERPERIQAMDARLQEVLGDAVEVDDDDDDEEEEDPEPFEFQPAVDEQITMVEYGSLIVEWREFVEGMNEVQLWPGDDGHVINIVQHYFGGFDDLMRLLYECLMERLRTAQ